MINESLDHLKLAVTVVTICLVIAAVLVFYFPVRDTAVRELNSIVDMQAKEARGTVNFIDGQVISGAEARQFCVRYQNSNIAGVPPPGSITDLRGLYSVSVNYDTEPAEITFATAAYSNLY